MTWSVATPIWVAPVGQHAHHREDDATGGADLLPVVGRARRLSEVMTEQLIGAVDQMDLHRVSLAAPLDVDPPALT